MMENKEQKKWKPDSEKHAEAWKRIYNDIVNSRRFYYSQLFGRECGQRYKPHPDERAYFMTWGKLPEHVIADNCEVCDRQQAERVMEWVSAYNQRYFDAVRKDAAKHMAAREKRMEKQRQMVEATDGYKASKDQRESLVKFADEWIERIRAEMSDIRTHGKTQGQQGHAPAEQGAETADSKEADTHTAEE